MKTDKKFDFGRFMLLTRKDLIDNAKLYAALAGGVSIAYVLVYMIVYKAMSELERQAYQSDVQGGMIVLGLVITAIACLAAASVTFSCLNSKTKRIAYLSLPASQSEKFASRMAITCVIAPIVFLTLWVAVDVVSMIVSVSIGESYSYGTLIPQAIETAGVALRVYDTALYNLLVSLSSMFAGVGLFVLGSALFRSSAFIKTALSLIAISFVLVVMGADNWLDYLEWELPTLWHVMRSVMPLAVGVVSIGASYVLFRRTDVNGYKLRR